MSMNDYQKLKGHNEAMENVLGCELPDLAGCHLVINTFRDLTAEQVASEVEAFQPVQGWVMYRDRVVVDDRAPSRHDFIEGEWCRGGDSLKTRLLGDGTYQLISMQLDEKDNGEHVCREQVVYLRSGLEVDALENPEAAIYRLWWQQEKQGPRKGRWIPLAQQFVGFHKESK